MTLVSKDDFFSDFSCLERFLKLCEVFAPDPAFVTNDHVDFNLENKPKTSGCQQYGKPVTIFI